MEAINDKAFAVPQFKAMAAGYGVGHYRSFDDGDRWVEPSDEINGGIRNPVPTLLPKGKRLVRFGGWNKRKLETNKLGPQFFASQTASGQWWLEWSDYYAIEQYADQINESVPYAIRQTCAVPSDWSDLSSVVQGVTRSPLRAYAGEGNIASGKNTVIDPAMPGKPVVRQLFIPGLSDPDLRKAAIFINGHGALDPGMSHEGKRAEAEREAAMRARLDKAVKRR